MHALSLAAHKPSGLVIPALVMRASAVAFAVPIPDFAVTLGLGHLAQIASQSGSGAGVGVCAAANSAHASTVIRATT
jgi:hypothetical protein